MSKRFLRKDEILSIDDLPREEVYCPEWDGYVIVRGLTASERDKFEQSIVDQRKGGMKMDLRNIRAKLVALCAIDEDGNRLFDDSDVEALGKKSATALNRLFEVAQRLSGLREQDVEELKGNS